MPYIMIPRGLHTIHALDVCKAGALTLQSRCSDQRQRRGLSVADTVVVLYSSSCKAKWRIGLPNVHIVLDGEGELSLREEIRLLLDGLRRSLRVGQRGRQVRVAKPSVHLHAIDQSR